MNKETNTKRLTYPMLPFLKLSTALFEKLRLQTYYFVSYDTLTDSMEFNNLLDERAVFYHVGSQLAYSHPVYSCFPIVGNYPLLCGCHVSGIQYLC